mmetsp:Transcript_105313/g.298085  ORF Transcript_105313/g.298085 Transcript_105313/m.298085 type:complete len:351 (+) Transcript_105313:658-1710(+)
MGPAARPRPPSGTRSTPLDCTEAPPGVTSRRSRSSPAPATNISRSLSAQTSWMASPVTLSRLPRRESASMTAAVPDPGAQQIAAPRLAKSAFHRSALCPSGPGSASGGATAGGSVSSCAVSGPPPPRSTTWRKRSLARPKVLGPSARSPTCESPCDDGWRRVKPASTRSQLVVARPPERSCKRTETDRVSSLSTRTQSVPLSGSTTAPMADSCPYCDVPRGSRQRRSSSVKRSARPPCRPSTLTPRTSSNLNVQSRDAISAGTHPAGLESQRSSQRSAGAGSGSLRSAAVSAAPPRASRGMPQRSRTSRRVPSARASCWSKSRMSRSAWPTLCPGYLCRCRDTFTSSRVL